MISLNSSHFAYALHALNSAINLRPRNLFSSLLKLVTINNSNTDLVKLSTPSLKMGPSVNILGQLQTLTPMSLQASSEETIEPSNTLKESLNIQPEKENFRLAKEMTKLYPRKDTPLDNIDRLVVFGDSLSDSQGHMYDKTHHLFPSYGQYYEGRFTNGFVWDEYLSSPTFLKKEVVNFAEGGSTSACYSHFNLVSNLLSNLDTQMKSYQPLGNDLVILCLGSNDYISLHKDNIINVVEKQVDDIEAMLNRGVKNIVVMGIPDISLSPDATHSDHKRKYKDISIAHNALLQENVAELRLKYPQKRIDFFDTSSSLKEIINIAKNIDYNTTDSYSGHGYIHNPLHTDPALNIRPEYLYNDGVHPTQEVHYAFATLLDNFITTHYAEAQEVS